MEKVLESLLTVALAKKSTDIHFQLDDHRNSILLRSLRGLVDYSMTDQLVDLYEYCKYKANLDLSMNMIPQTGSFEFVIKKKKYQLRFSVIETFYSRSGVLRILNLHKTEKIEDLSNASIRSDFERLDGIVNGMILFCGSTGSGKTTTMFTWLRSIKKRRIYTVEDPIEQIYSNFMQIQVNKKQGLSFDEAIFQLLRHDPDIIVIGEIRGPLEAKAAIRSSYSGHLVVATIHCSSINQVEFRLKDFGIPQCDIDQTLRAVVFQRLVVSDDSKERGAQFEFVFKQQTT